MIQWMLAIWSLVLLTFLISTFTSGSSPFTYCLKPSLKDFEHNLASMCNVCNCMVIWTFLGIAFLWDWNENWPFPVLWPLLICWHIESSTLTASSFRIWNSSTGIPSPLLALFVVMVLKAHLTSHSRMSSCRWVPERLSGSLRTFFVQFFCVFLLPLLHLLLMIHGHTYFHLFPQLVILKIQRLLL